MSMAQALENKERDLLRADAEKREVQDAKRTKRKTSAKGLHLRKKATVIDDRLMEDG